jgi:hypothetical protein
MEYKALFGINHGVNSGFGVQYSDYVERTESIEADSPEKAMHKAAKMAGSFGVDYFIDPGTKKTGVRINEIVDADGNKLDQGVYIEEVWKNYIKDDGCFFVEVSLKDKEIQYGLRLMFRK